MRSAPVIAPAILAHDFSEFESHITRVDTGFFPYVHIDVMDGLFVPHTSFKEIDKINELSPEIPFELHLMVNDPLAELEKWAEIGNVFRTIFHVESPDNLDIALSFAEDTEMSVGLALNPKTSLASLRNYLHRIDLVQFMTVEPGAQGSPFIDAVKEKIKIFTTDREGVLVGVDGAVNAGNIKELRDLGVDIFTVGSALVNAFDIEKAYNDLKSKLA